MGRKRRTGWTRVAFGKIAASITDRIDDPAEAGVNRYVGLEHLDPDSLTIRRWGVPADVSATKLRFRAGDIIFGRRRVYQRKVAVADFDGICSAHALVLRARPEAVLPEFLPFFMQSDLFMERAKTISVGSLSPTINWRTLAQEEFTLPPPPEQHRLSRVLGATTDVAERCRGLAAISVRARLSAADNLLSRFPADTVPVADLLREPPRNGISPLTNPNGGGLRTVSVGAVRQGAFDPEGSIKRAIITTDSARPFFVQRGDVFVVRGNGNRSLCGRAGLSSRSYDDLFYPDLLIRLRFDPTRILPEFAVTQWNLPQVHRFLASRSKSTNGIWKINGQDIRTHTLAVPTLRVQQDFLDSVRPLLTATDAATHRAAEAQRLKDSIF